MANRAPDWFAQADLVEKGRVLDGFYIPTRYANGHPEGAPFELPMLPAPAEIVVYSEDELRTLAESGVRFAQVVAEEVVWLVDREAPSS